MPCNLDQLLDWIAEPDNNVPPITASVIPALYRFDQSFRDECDASGRVAIRFPYQGIPDIGTVAQWETAIADLMAIIAGFAAAVDEVAREIQARLVAEAKCAFVSGLPTPLGEITAAGMGC